MGGIIGGPKKPKLPPPPAPEKKADRRARVQDKMNRRRGAAGVENEGGALGVDTKSAATAGKTLLGS